MRAPKESAKNLVGFSGSLFYDFTPHVAVGGEVSIVFGSNRIGTNIDTSLHRYTYLFGPQFSFNANDKVKVFVHPLFGGVHDTTKTTIGTTSVSSSATAFAMAFGGGVDVGVSSHIAVRPFQFDYVLTHFGAPRQNNFRFSSGIVFELGKK